MTTFAVRAKNLSKCYQIYAQPLDRLKQSLWRGRKQFYKEFWAIQDVSFDIEKGETLGIIGSNGSGKSTLLQLICGILKPTQGELEVRGKIAALLELGAGFNLEFTGRENVLMNAAIMGLTRAEIESRYDDIVAFADIGQFIHQPVKTYSSGMYVRLAFAVAIHVSPDILVVDEALAVGDLRFQQKCISKIRKFCENGTVIFVSHDTGAVKELCSRVIWIDSGKIRMEGKPKAVAEKYLEYMYEGKSGAGTAVSSYSSIARDTQETAVEPGEFSPVGSHIRQFGDGRVSIKAVRLLSGGKNHGVVYSGKSCEISMIMKANADVSQPIAGYLVKDRLGRDVIGDNTFLMQQNISQFSKNHSYLITFKIDIWPNLQEGDYTLCLALADGTMSDHTQCHLLHDALIFKSVPVRMPAGIFSISNTDLVFEEMSANTQSSLTL